MKKLFILTAFAICCITTDYAQSLAFFKNGVQLENGAEIQVTNCITTPIPGELEIPADLMLKNLTNMAMDVRMRQTILEYQGAGDNLINWCFNSCSNVPVATTTLDRTSTITANSFEENFHANFIVYHNEYATVKVRYEVFPQGSLESYSVIVNFVYDQNSTSALVENAKINDNFHFLQSNGNLCLEYVIDSDIQLEVLNITGIRVAQHLLLSSENKFNLLEKMPKGVYIFAIKNGNVTMVNYKFIVQ